MRNATSFLGQLWAARQLQGEGDGALPPQDPPPVPGRAWGCPPSGFRNLWAPRLPRSEEERFPRRVVLETGQSVVPFAPVGCHSWSPSPLPTRGQDNICHLHNVCAFAVWHSLLLQINAFTIKPKCQKKRQPTLRSRLPPSKGV